MSECRWDTARRIVGLLALGALLGLVFHGALPHPHHDEVSAQNCPVCHLGKTAALQPTVQPKTEAPLTSEPNPPDKESARTADPAFDLESTRAPPLS